MRKITPLKKSRKPIVIGVSGKAGAGKDTICNFLMEHHGFSKIALADPIKRLVKDVFVLTDEQTHDRVLREKPLKDWPGWTVRKLLQIIGTEMFRNTIDQDIWVKSLCKRIKSSYDLLWVVPDVRFPNEQATMKKMFKNRYISIRVERPGKDGNTDGGVKNHQSESYVLDADFVFQNDSTIQDLGKKVCDLMSKLKIDKAPPPSKYMGPQKDCKLCDGKGREWYEDSFDSDNGKECSVCKRKAEDYGKIYAPDRR